MFKPHAHRARSAGRRAKALAPAAALALALAWPAAFAPAQPASRPAPGAMAPDRGGDRGGGGGGGRAGEGRRWQVSGEEMARAMEFASKYMPSLYRVIDGLPKGSPPARHMTRFAVERYRMAQRVQREDPDEYEALLARFASQDEVFDLVQQYQSAADDEARRSELREQIRAKVREILVDTFEERERRIHGLRRQLDREVQDLADDRQRIDEVAEERVERLLSRMHNAPESPGNDGPRGDAVDPVGPAPTTPEAPSTTAPAHPLPAPR